MDREIRSAVDYILMHASNGEIAPDALRILVEDRVRMACAEAIGWQARAATTAADQLRVRR